MLLQELSPTNDANLVFSHMSLMETLMDEFQDEETFKKLNEREVTAWLEVNFLSLSYISVCSKHGDNAPTS